jgi:hypothetical protein
VTPTGTAPHRGRRMTAVLCARNIQVIGPAEFRGVHHFLAILNVADKPTKQSA